MADNDDNYDDGTYVQIPCAGCGDPLTVTAHTARVDDDNTYCSGCFGEEGDDDDG